MKEVTRLSQVHFEFELSKFEFKFHDSTALGGPWLSCGSLRDRKPTAKTKRQGCKGLDGPAMCGTNWRTKCSHCH